MTALQAQSGLGLLLLCTLAWALGGCRRPIPWRVVAAGLGGQLFFAALLLHVPGARRFFDLLGGAVDALAAATREGTGFVFGYLGGAPLPFAETRPGASFVLFFQALPLVLVVGALSALLYHWRILPAVVSVLSRGLHRAFGISGACGFSVAANVFVGMVEAPLLIRAWLATLPTAELFAVMVAGLATISGNMLVVYATLIAPVVPDAAGQLLAASLVGAPAAILAALLMMPPGASLRPGAEAAALAAAPGPGVGPTPPTAPADAASATAALPITADPPPAAAAAPAEADDPPMPPLYDSAMEAIVRGTQDGLSLLLGIMATLIVFVALVALADAVLQPLTGLTVRQIMGWVMWPLALAMGVPLAEAGTVAASLGVKVAVNEFVSYLELATSGGAGLSERSRLILTWALCGFTNFASVGIMVGGLTVMCPERRPEIVRLGLPSLLAATLACCMMGAVVGLLTPG
ncbi:NupC/NupG family nucleoside CNT transporter [Roseomonas sp. BN140053]|uniref:NupC/NupG family nucleoside CNT transporter n=1 Tax=Roseomonas sp. BN140053 TaxID=3391898 RepID=UPI0039E93196